MKYIVHIQRREIRGIDLEFETTGPTEAGRLASEYMNEHDMNTEFAGADGNCSDEIFSIEPFAEGM